MKIKQIIVLAAIISVIVLSSCSPVDPPTATLPPTETPTITPSSTSTPVLAPTNIPPSPTVLPTQPESTYAVITPEPAELERWQEYEEALGNAIYERVLRVDILCEWLIVGRADRKVYVWVACSGIRPYDSKLTTFVRSAVVYLGSGGEIQRVGTIGNTPGSSYGAIRRKLFPPDILEILEHMPRVDDRMLEHLESRRENPELPLIVLDATPTS
jgi:hypothetical protein